MKAPHSSPYPDYLNIESQLSSEQLDIMHGARDLVRKNFMPQISDNFEAGVFDSSIPEVLGKHGLIGSNLSFQKDPHDEISYGLVMRELERCDSALRSFVSVQGSLVMYPIAAYGSEAQKEKWLSGLSKGTLVGSFALTEPQGGSDPSSMLTSADKKNDCWVLNGSKRWVTNGNIADVILVWAKTTEGVRCFICPADAEGVQRTHMKGKLSLRASQTSEIEFDQVRLPLDSMLPKATGLGRALDCLNQARYGIVWGVLGAAEACFDEAIKYSSERKLFGKHLHGFQMVQGKLADMCLQLSQAQLLAFRLGQLKNENKLLPGHVSLGKQGNVEMALKVARTCRDILGANGILLDYVSMRHMCNLETVLTYEGTHDIHKLIVGQQLTGEAAFQ